VLEEKRANATGSPKGDQHRSVVSQTKTVFGARRGSAEGVVYSHEIGGRRGGVLLVRAGFVEEHSLLPAAAAIRLRHRGTSARQKAEGASARGQSEKTGELDHAHVSAGYLGYGVSACSGSSRGAKLRRVP